MIIKKYCILLCTSFSFAENQELVEHMRFIKHNTYWQRSHNFRAFGFPGRQGASLKKCLRSAVESLFFVRIVSFSLSLRSDKTMTFTSSCIPSLSMFPVIIFLAVQAKKKRIKGSKSNIYSVIYHSDAFFELSLII